MHDLLYYILWFCQVADTKYGINFHQREKVAEFYSLTVRYSVTVSYEKPASDERKV